MKRCSSCKETKNLSEFNESKTYCRTCASFYNKRWWKNRPAEKVEYRRQKEKEYKLKAKITGKKALSDRKYNLTHKEARRVFHRRWVIKHKEAVRVINRRYYIKHKEAVCKRCTSWQKEKIISLSDYWIRKLLRHQWGYYIPSSSFWDDIIKAKREQLLAWRTYHKIRKEIGYEKEHF